MPAKNYSNRKKNDRENQNGGVAGVVLIIISVFFLLCITFSDFSVISKAIRNIIIGLVGFSAYPFFICMLILGISITRNRRALLSARNIACIISAGVCLILLLQFATTQKYMQGFTEYIDAVFDRNTVGGVLFGTIVYAISIAITKPLTYAFLIITMLILLGLLFSNLLGGKSRKSKSLKRGKANNELPNRGFVKGVATPNLMRSVRNNGLFVETITPPATPKHEDTIITQSGKFDQMEIKQQPSLSKYSGGKVEFQKYHDNKKQAFEGKYKNDAQKMFFEQSKEERLLGYGAKQRPSFTPQSNAYDSQKNLYERHISNYIPGVGSEPEIVKAPDHKNYGAKSTGDSIAGKYGLREIALPPSKNFSDRYIGGTILNGEDISDNLKQTHKETPSSDFKCYPNPVVKTAPYIIDGSNYDAYNKSSFQTKSDNLYSSKSDEYQQHNGIINGDFFTKEESEAKRRHEELRSQEELRRREELNQKAKQVPEDAYNNLNLHGKPQGQYFQSSDYNRPSGLEKEAQESNNFASLGKYSTNNSNSVYEDGYTAPDNRDFSRESTFDALLKADKAINRTPERGDIFDGADEIANVDSLKEDENYSCNNEEDDYYQPFENEQNEDETFFSSSLKDESNFKSSAAIDNQPENIYNGGSVTSTSSLQNESIVTENSKYDSFENFNRDSEILQNSKNIEERSFFGNDEKSFEQFSQFDGSQNSAVQSLDESQLTLNNDDIGFAAQNIVDKNEDYGIKIDEEIVDKSETEFNEKYQTGYYSKDDDDSSSQDDLRIVQDFREKVHRIENNVFAKENKFKPANQINIDDYLKSAAPITEKPVVKRKKTYRYVPPPVDLLLDNSTDPSLYGGDCEKKAVILEDTLRSLKFPSKVIGITKGPAVTRYEMETTPGIPIKRVENCAKDIAYALASDGKIRIETPIPGRRAIGVEVPNEQISTVCLRDIISSKEFIAAPSCLTLAVGKDITGNIIVSNLEKMPHLLIAGATGTGKSVCLNSLITSILYKSSPEDVRLILIDPKRVEFAVFKDMPHLLMKNIITEPTQVMNAFRWAKDEMERRYKLFSRYVNKNIQEFNNSNHVKSGSEPKMPYIVIIVDELSDLMMPHSNCRRELEDKIMSMAQKARAAGIHLILATQRPSVDVITGTIKANLPSRIAFAVTSIPDSRTILDQSGAEALLGKGDMLYSPLDWSDPRRVQGAFITSEEVEAVVEYVKQNNNFDFDDDAEKIIMREEEEPDTKEDVAEENALDPHIKEALKRVIETGQASTSMIQRRFSVGYARAARIMDQMEAHKFVGPSEGAKPREVYITREQFREIFGEDV